MLDSSSLDSSTALSNAPGDAPSLPPSSPPVRIDPEIAALLPPLLSDEREALRESLLQEGCRQPLVTWQGLLLDGHQRLALCQEHDLPFRTEEIILPDRDAALRWAVRTQLARRNLSLFERAELALRYRVILHAQTAEMKAAIRLFTAASPASSRKASGTTAEERIATATGLPIDPPVDPATARAALDAVTAAAPSPLTTDETKTETKDGADPEDETPSEANSEAKEADADGEGAAVGERGESRGSTAATSPPIPLSRGVRKALAEAAGCSEDTIRKADHLRRHLPPSLLDRVRRGEQSLHSAYHDLSTLTTLRHRPDLQQTLIRMVEAGEAPTLRDADQLRFRRSLLPCPPGAWTLEQTDTTAHLPDGFADLLLTDPPYGISEPGKVVRKEGALAPADFDGDDEWDAPDGYLDRLEGWVAEWARLVRPGGSVVSFIDGAKLSHLWEAMERHGLQPKRILVWHKTNPSPAPLARRNLMSACEFLVWAVQPGAPYAFQAYASGRWNQHNFVERPVVHGAERVHPCQKPVELLEDLVRLLTEEGDRVLDPFAGSGSTGVAASRAGRRSHLIEQDPGYCGAIEARLEGLGIDYEERREAFERRRAERERAETDAEEEDAEEEDIEEEDAEEEDEASEMSGETPGDDPTGEDGPTGEDDLPLAA